jgi:MFS family permease
MALFALQPVAIGGWLTLIPHVQGKLDLSKSELAISLLGLSVALILALQIAGRLVDRVGPRRVFMVVFPIQAVAILSPLCATGQASLFLALMTVGGTSAFLQVCLNVYAGRLEIAHGVFIMNRCHGFWSLGLGLGSLIVALFSSLTSPLVALAATSWTSALLGVVAAFSLPRIQGEKPAVTKRRTLGQVPRQVLMIAAMLFPVTMAEGAMADWAAIYMAEILPSGATHAGLAVTLYAGAVTVGRFLGDRLKNRMGAMALAKATLLTAIAGLVLLALPIPPLLGLLGFAIVGLGVSVAFPLGVSAAAPIQREYEASNIALISTIAITGFLIGPPMIGFLADAIHLRAGLAALIPALCASFWLANSLNHSESTESVH